MKTKNRGLVIITILIFSMLLVYSKSFAQKGSRVLGEIMGEVIGLSSEEDEWRVNALCLTSIRWDWDDWVCYLTTNYGTAYVVGIGNSESERGFRAPCGHMGQHYDMAFGKYKFTFNLPDGYADNSFVLDLRDADWTASYSPPKDIWIRCHITSSTSSYFEWKRGQGGTYSSDMKSSIWEMFGIENGHENKQAFQPTPPKNFHCTNPTSYGYHPNLAG